MKFNVKQKLYIYMLIACVFVLVMSVGSYLIKNAGTVRNISADYYKTLPDNAPDEDPLQWIGEDFTVDKESFVSNLPLVVIHKNEELADYKSYKDNVEMVDETLESWTTGTIALYDLYDGRATFNTEPSISSDIKIKKRGHTSYFFDKSQYYIKLVDEKGEENPQNILGMGVDDAWVLNGSMADKSMLRNYIAYRVAAQIMEYAPRCCFCEMFTEENGIYTYQGVYLMLESVKRGENRVPIDESKRKNVYTSYIVRRDRYSNFDIMLDTYARLNGLDEEWIGVKYPATAKQTKENIAYIENDFSSIEKIIYSKNPEQLKKYPECIDVTSFVDYFIINEYFGNYDAGLHSTYMYKNSGDRLKIGPVWDFDQAMNNSMISEADPYTLAMQEKAFYKQLFTDTEFLAQVKQRYAKHRATYLNDDYIFGLMNETVKYLSAAREREWYRWADNYCVKELSGPGKYKLNPYTKGGVEINRMNTEYEQELYTIRTYLSIHGEIIQSELSLFEEDCKITTGLKGEMTVLLMVCLVLFIIPSILINRK